MAVLSQDDILINLKVQADQNQINGELEKITKNSNVEISVSQKGVAAAITAQKALQSTMSASEKATLRLATSTVKIEKSQGGFIKNTLALVRNFKGFNATIKEGTELFNRYDEKLLDLAKSTDTTKKQAGGLAAEILKINTRTQVDDLLSLGVAAGKLGIDFDKIPGFVKAADDVFVALGDNIKGSAEEIAVDLGKIAANFGLLENNTPEVALRKVASVINDLDTIVGKADLDNVKQFATNFSGIAKEADIAAPEVLALGAIIDDAGISINVASTALSNLIPNIAQNVDKFAELAGVTSEEFLNFDTITQLEQVLKGAASSAGGIQGLSETLESLGVQGKAGAAIVSLASNIDGLRPAIDATNKSFNEFSSVGIEAVKKNTESTNAVTEQAKKRYDTLLLSINRVTGAFDKFSVKGALTRGTLKGIDLGARGLKSAAKVGGVAIAGFGALVIAQAKEFQGLSDQLLILKEGFIGVGKDLGKGLGSAFTGALDSFDNAKEGITGFGKEIAFFKTLISGTIEEVRDAANSDAFDRGRERGKAIIALQKENIELNKAEIADNKELLRIQSQLADTTLKRGDRISLLKQQLELERSFITNQKIRLLGEKQLLDTEIARDKLEGIEENRADVQKSIDLQNQLNQLEQEEANLTRDFSVERREILTNAANLVASLALEYEQLGRQIEISIEDDPLRKLGLNARNEVKLLQEALKLQTDDILLNGLNEDEQSLQIQRITENTNKQIEVIKKELRIAISELDNELTPLINNSGLLERFINGDKVDGKSIEITDILPDDQFAALVSRFKVINQQIASIGNPENVVEFNLKDALNAELEEIIKLLGDSPEAEEVKKLLGQFQVSTVDNEQRNNDKFAQDLEYFNQAVGLASQLSDVIIGEERRRLEAQIEIQEERISKIREIADKGNAEQLQLEETRLEELTAKREDAIKKQAAISKAAKQAEIIANTALTISSIQLGAARSFAETGVAAPVVVPIVLAAIAGLIATAANIFTPPALYEGTDYSLSDTLGHKPGRDSHLIYGDNSERMLKGSLNKQVIHMKSDKLVENALLGEQFKMGKIGNIAAYQIPNERMIGKVEYSHDYRELLASNKRLEKQNKDLIRAINGRMFDFRMDENGIGTIASKKIVQDSARANRFKRETGNTSMRSQIKKKIKFRS